MKKIYLLIIPLFFLQMFLFAQKDQYGKNQSKPISKNNNEKLNTLDSLDSFLSTFMTSNHVPGLAACIVNKDSIIWQGYYGYADMSLNKPVTASTIFNIASISKTIMVTALMQLYEQGKFKLDDSINAYLPFQVRNPYFPSIPITFKMLLTHTSSIQDNWDAMPWQFGDYPMTLGTYLQKYFTPGEQYYNASLNFYSYTPGTTWNYSNNGAALVGYLVEIMSGIPFDKYCKDSVFTPLQMSHTAWFLRDLDTTLIARPYTYSSGTYIDNGLYGYTMYPSGQLRTTLASLAKFLVANMNLGELNGSRILDSTTIRLMRTVYVPIIGGAFYEFQWGLIWLKEKWSGHGLWGHTGADWGVSSAMWLSEIDTTGVIFLSNIDWMTYPWRTVVNRLVDEAHALIVGVHDATTKIPERFKLHQNYPNPFNPITKISWQLPVANQVTLKVYDILGREVVTLVNEYRQAGKFETEFNATNLPSGVYFYRIQAGSFIETKKMVLLK